MNCQTLIIHYRYAYVKKNMSRNCLHALPRPCKVNPFVKLSSSKNIKNEQTIYISIILSCMKTRSI